MSFTKQPPTNLIATPHSRYNGAFILKNEDGGFGDFLATPFSTSSENENSSRPEQTLFMIVNSAKIKNTNNNENNDENESQKLFRRWNPFVSPIAAAMLGGLEFVPAITNNNGTNNILYIGNRFTSSAIHLGDILNNNNNNNNNGNNNEQMLVSVIFPGDSESVETKSIQQLNESRVRLDQDKDTKEDYPQESKPNGCFEVNEEGITELFESNSLPLGMKEPILISSRMMEENCGERLGKLIQEKITNRLNSFDEVFFDAVFVEISHDSRFPFFESSKGFENFIHDLVSPISNSFMKEGSGLLVFVDASSNSSSSSASGNEAETFASVVVDQLRTEGFKPREQVTLEPFFKKCAVIVAVKK